MTKRELYTIELQVAEFEISMLRVERAGGNKFYLASRLEKDNEKNTAKSHKIDSSEQNLNNQIDRFSEREMATSVIYGNEVPEILGVEQRIPQSWLILARMVSGYYQNEGKTKF